MHRWFCGFSAQAASSQMKFPQPVNGRQVWHGLHPLWLCGTWNNQQLVTTSEASTHLAVIGTLLAPFETLTRMFQQAVKTKEYSSLMQLPGNYNLIIQDGADVIIFVDAVGLRPVYYFASESSLAYSSFGIPLQQLTKAEVDRDWLANALAGLSTLNLSQNRSPFCQIKVIPPGHFLHFSAGRLKCQRYWYPAYESLSFAEAAEQLREQLLIAVEKRVDLYGTTTSDMSGGFDSTSLALIAAKHLEAQGQELHTVTFKGVLPTESEDVKWAKHAASLYSNILPTLIEGHELPAEYSHLDAVPLTDMPDTILLAMGQIRHVTSIIRSKGSQLHMSGEGGDPVLSDPPAYLADLVKRMRINPFLRHAYGWSRVGQSSPLPILRSAIKLSRTSYPQWLLQQARKLTIASQSFQSLITHPPIDEIMGWDYVPNLASWHTQKTVDLIRTDLQSWASRALPFAELPGQQNYMTLIYSTGIRSAVHQQLAAIQGVNLEFPFFDASVIEACLAAKAEERTTPFAYKPILSKALSRELPQSVFSRTTKGDYTTEEFVGLRKNLSAIHELFQSSVLADRGLISLEALQSYLQPLSMGLAAGSWSFHQTLAIELWLRRVQNVSQSFWLEAAVVAL